MKRISISVLFLFLPICFAQENFGSISQAVGKVMVFSQKRQGWVNAGVGQGVAIHDTVTTSEESRTEIRCANGGIVRIDERSKVLLAPAREAQGPGVSVIDGKLWANMKKIMSQKRSFQVSTSTATAAIRGTVFRVNAQSDTAADVLVYEGAVAVAPRTKSGSASDSLIPKKQVSGPRRVAGPRQVSLEDWVTIVAGQKISVTRDGEYRKTEFDRAADAQTDWVNYNQKQDALEEKVK